VRSFALADENGNALIDQSMDGHVEAQLERLRASGADMPASRGRTRRRKDAP